MRETPDAIPKPKMNGFWMVRPLTRTRKDNGAVYHRESDVEAEVKRLCGLNDRDRRRTLLERVAANDPRRLHEETLVCFVREYTRHRDSDTAWQIAEVLVERIAGHVQRKLARWRLSPDEAEECMQDLTAALCEAVFRCEPDAEFWEVRFWVCLDRRLWSLVEKRQSVLDTEIRPSDDFGSEEESASGAEGIFARIADTSADPETLAQRKAAMSILTENERLAVYLKYIEGLPEESDDPERETVARLLKVTGRSVRNYLRRAEAKLMEWAQG